MNLVIHDQEPSTIDPSIIDRETTSGNYFETIHLSVKDFVASLDRSETPVLHLDDRGINVFIGNKDLPRLLRQHGMSLLITPLQNGWVIRPIFLDNVYERMVINLTEGRKLNGDLEEFYRAAFLGARAMIEGVATEVTIGDQLFKPEHLYIEGGLIDQARDVFKMILDGTQQKLIGEGLHPDAINQAYDVAVP